MATESAATSPRQAKSRRRIVPLWYWLLLAIVIGVNVWARVSDDLDHAIANIIGMVSVFVLALTLVICLGWKAVAIALGLVAVTAILFRIDYWTAELLPHFVWRFSTPPDQALAKPAAAEQTLKIPLDVATDDDFPQFLGPDRSLGIDRIALARAWPSTPPPAWQHPLWKHTIGAGHSAFSAVNGYAVTMEQRGEDELVTCYDLLTGDLKWSHGIKARHATSFGGLGPRSTPTIYEGKVYAMGATGVLRCLDATTGSLVWSKNLLEETGTAPDDETKQIAWGRAASPLIVDNLVVVPGGGPKEGHKISLIAFDREKGTKMWQAGDRQVSYASPALARLGGVRQIISVNEDNITGHNAATGAVLWEFAWPGSSSMNANSSQAIAVADDRVFVSKGYGGGSALFAVKHDAAKDTWATEAIWQNKRNLQTKMTNVVIYKGFVYGLSDGVLECIDLATGKRRWKDGHYDHGQILRVRDLLLVETEDGAIVLVELTPDGHHELGSFQAVDGPTWNNLCLYGRYLLVRNSVEAACYELPLEGAAKPPVR